MGASATALKLGECVPADPSGSDFTLSASVTISEGTRKADLPDSINADCLDSNWEGTVAGGAGGG